MKDIRKEPFKKDFFFELAYKQKNNKWVDDYAKEVMVWIIYYYFIYIWLMILI